MSARPTTAANATHSVFLVTAAARVGTASGRLAHQILLALQSSHKDRKRRRVADVAERIDSLPANVPFHVPERFDEPRHGRPVAEPAKSAGGCLAHLRFPVCREDVCQRGDGPGVADIAEGRRGRPTDGGLVGLDRIDKLRHDLNAKFGEVFRNIIPGPGLTIVSEESMQHVKKPVVRGRAPRFRQEDVRPAARGAALFAFQKQEPGADDREEQENGRLEKHAPSAPCREPAGLFAGRSVF
jgi:hypothetical protein